MRTTLPLVALVALSIAGCSSSSTSVLGPSEDQPVASCRGNSGNCGAGGQHNNNPNNPPTTAP
jgi:hypothetical protein